MLNTLSGRFLLITAAFVLLAEVLILVPSVARYRETYLFSRLERAQIASLAVEAGGGMVSPDLEQELLENAGVLNVVLRRDDLRQLVLNSPIPAPVAATYDLREATLAVLLRDAILRLWDPEPRIIRVIGAPVQGGGTLIEFTMHTGPLRHEMIETGLRVLTLSAVIAGLTAGLLFLAVRRVLLLPIRGLVGSMRAYADAPEDGRRVLTPTARLVELREAETALNRMQTQLTGALRQKERLAQLGTAVAKVSHDLRNMLTTAQLLADRMELSRDPAVQRAAPKLVASISRAVSLCEGTLAFGRAEEPPPRLQLIALDPLVRDVFESDALAPGAEMITHRAAIPPGLRLRADPEQLYRILSNLVRNAHEAIAATGRPGEIAVIAREEDAVWRLTISDTGPGLPQKARDNLFRAFQGGIRKGGTGLGLAIAADLARGHGGQLDLLRSDGSGTTFELILPRALTPAAETTE